MDTGDDSGVFKEVQMEDERFIIRRLDIADYGKGFIDLLGQLTVCGHISEEEFHKRFQELKALQDDHFIGVIEDIGKGQIVATGSIFLEKKFLRACGKVGHIEDVVVDSSIRGKHLGQMIVNLLSEYAKQKGCYKAILDCNVENKGFYEKCGFKEKSVQMALYF